MTRSVPELTPALAASFAAGGDSWLLTKAGVLRALTCNGIGVDLSPVREHGALRTLGVGGRRISLRPLAGLTALTQLWWGAGTTWPQAISKLTGLETLFLYGPYIEALDSSAVQAVPFAVEPIRWALGRGPV